MTVSFKQRAVGHKKDKRKTARSNMSGKITLPRALVEGFLKLALRHNDTVKPNGYVSLAMKVSGSRRRTDRKIESVVKEFQNESDFDTANVRRLPIFVEPSVGLYMRYQVTFLRSQGPPTHYMIRAGMIANKHAKDHFAFTGRDATVRDLNVLWQASHPAVALNQQIPFIVPLTFATADGSQQTDHAIFYSIRFEKTLYKRLRTEPVIENKEDIAQGVQLREDVVRSTFAGLGYLHHHGVTHGCLSPHSISILPDVREGGGRWIAQLFDFTQATSTRLGGPHAAPAEGEERAPVNWFNETDPTKQELPSDFYRVFKQYETTRKLKTRGARGDMHDLPVALLPLFLSYYDVEVLLDMLKFWALQQPESGPDHYSVVKECQAYHGRTAFSFLGEEYKYKMWTLLAGFVYRRDPAFWQLNSWQGFDVQFEDDPDTGKKYPIVIESETGREIESGLPRIQFKNDRIPEFFWLDEKQAGPSAARRMQLLFAMCSTLYNSVYDQVERVVIEGNVTRVKRAQHDQLEWDMARFNKLWMGYDYRGEVSRISRGNFTSIKPEWRHRNDTLTETFRQQHGINIGEKEEQAFENLRDLLLKGIFDPDADTKFTELVTNEAVIGIAQKGRPFFPWPAYVQYSIQDLGGDAPLDPQRAWDDLRNTKPNEFMKNLALPLGLGEFDAPLGSGNLEDGRYTFKGMTVPPNDPITNRLITKDKTGEAREDGAIVLKGWVFRKYRHMKWQALEAARNSLRQISLSRATTVEQQLLNRTQELEKLKVMKTLANETAVAIKRFFLPDNLQDIQNFIAPRVQDWLPPNEWMPQSEILSYPVDAALPASRDRDDFDWNMTAQRQRVMRSHAIGLRYLCLDHMQRGEVARIAAHRGSSLSIEIVYIDEAQGNTKNVYIYYPNADADQTTYTYDGLLRLESLHYSPTGELMSHIQYMIRPSAEEDTLPFFVLLAANFERDADGILTGNLEWPDVDALETPYPLYPY